MITEKTRAFCEEHEDGSQRIEKKIFEAVKNKGSHEEKPKPKAPASPAAKSVSKARAKIDIAVDDDE